MTTANSSAPGRINIIGEHTDYNDGLVLPTPLPQRITVTLRTRDDRLVQTRTDVPLTPRSGTYRLGEERAGSGWLDYVQGVTRALTAHGHRIGGCDIEIASTVPVGAGLGSSGALEVALLRTFREAFGLRFDDVTVAKLGQEAEHFVGPRAGLLDQLAASLGVVGSALLIDLRDLAHETVPLPRGVDLLVIDSGVRHAHAQGEYNRRRAECEEACRRLGIASLRDLTPERLGAALARLPETNGRRARHVVSENGRVREAVEAIRANDAPRLGALLTASHRSLRDDYAVSTPELDFLVSAAEAGPGVFGARLIGGGFGGSVLVLAKAGSATDVADRVLAAHRERFARDARLVVAVTPSRSRAR